MNKKTTTIRISGDSGDGIQIIGGILSQNISKYVKNVNTITDFPSEIRAPVGTPEGVSSFQITYGESENIPPSNKADIIFIMNPASLKVNSSYIKKETLVFVNGNSFNEEGLFKAGYSSNPIIDGTFSGNKFFEINLNEEVLKILEEVDLMNSKKLKCKNFYALGMLYEVLGLEQNFAKGFIEKKFKNDENIKNANTKSFLGGLSQGKELSLEKGIFSIERTKKKGKYRILNGNEAAAYGLISGAKLMGKKLYYGSYPITPASDILHTLVKYKSEDIIAFQAEDEIAAIGGSIGASYAGALGVTGTSGPGFSLKTEALNLAVMAELPIIVVDVQRGGPSTGLPTKTEQGDLLQAFYGRHGESPVVVMAVSNIEDCYYLSIEASRIATKYMTPVIILSDGFLSSNSEIFSIPNIEDLPEMDLPEISSIEEFKTGARNPETQAKSWIVPGMAGYEYRTGGLEKNIQTGKVSYDGINHEKMVNLRANKVENVVAEIPEIQINGKSSGDLLVIGWGSTYSSIYNAVIEAQNKGYNVSSIHLKYLNPLPRDLEKILKNFKKILLPEMNSGQLKSILQAKYNIEIIGLNKIKGEPFYVDEILGKIGEIIK